MTGFMGDDALDYDRLRTVFAPGSGLAMDEPYRRAHLPLVAPDHPAVIAEDAARGYRMGRHETVWSLVIPTPWDALAASPAFIAMERALRQSPLAGKIAWDHATRRRPVLHATICGGLGQGDAPPVLDAQRRLEGCGPFRIRLRGLFSGNINLGRLYLRLYPERIDGANAVQTIQERLGRPQTGLYLVGLHNLTDDLSPDEAARLKDGLDRFWMQDWAEVTVNELWLLGARDDLALDSEVAERIILR